MKTITVKHEVSPGRESCEFGGDFWGKEVCKYHTFRTQTHGRKHCIETMFEAAYKLAYPPFGHRERQHDSWGTCIDLVHAIEHQQWLDAPENKREAPGTTNRSFDPVPLGHEPFPKIERVDE